MPEARPVVTTAWKVVLQAAVEGLRPSTPWCDVKKFIARRQKGFG